MSIFDIDKPITKKFLKSKGFKKCYKAYHSGNGFLGVRFYPCHYPKILRCIGKQPNTAIICHYDSLNSIEYIYFNDIYTENDINNVLGIWETKYKNIC